MAHTKAGGTTKLGRDSNAQRLGVKVGDGQQVHAGAILVRQRGSWMQAGVNVGRDKDDTLFATATGRVKYGKRQKTTFTGARVRKTTVSVEFA